MTTRSKFFRLFGWSVAATATILGVIFATMREITVWNPESGDPEVLTSSTIDVEPAGLVLLAVGILSLVALSIAESTKRREL